MALSLQSLFLIFATFLSLLNLGNSATCSDCFIHSRAAYYPNSDENGTDTGRCGFGSFGMTINGGDVSAVSDLYRDGVGCGACYQVRCTDSNLCSDKGVTIVITDQGSGPNTDFILSSRAFRRMAQTTDSATYLLSQGVVDIEYRRVSCSYPNRNITIKIDENSNYPYYLAFVIWYQQGKKDITAVQLCECPYEAAAVAFEAIPRTLVNNCGVNVIMTMTALQGKIVGHSLGGGTLAERTGYCYLLHLLQTQNFSCKLLDRSHGAIWTTTSPPSGPLSLRMLFSDDDGDEEWVVPVNNIPENWKGGDQYDSGVQVNV